ncbi:MAG: galactosyltransferase-related protein [Acidobacteriota bacterium]
MTYSLRQKLGAVVYDLPRFLWAMRSSSRAPWLLMRNRDERLVPSNDQRGVSCDWQWTSDLHVAKVFPRLGLRLMKRALRDWPIESRDEPAKQKVQASPALSFIIGHRGKERLPHLLATLRSIAAQRDVAFECIVVEQSISPEVRDQLPGWVRYVHTPLPYAEMPYSRAWAFNCGARAAQAEALVLHDNDMLVPVDYAKEIIGRVEEGYEVMNLKRFIFYLSEPDSSRTYAAGELAAADAPVAIVQNALGGTIAVSREAYFAIGGLDESFVGWGGEDNEFWERAQTRSCWPFGYLPIVHLWHAPQAGKVTSDRSTAKRFEELSRVPVSERIADLAAKGKELRARS